MSDLCKAIKEDGARCGVDFGLDDEGLCWHHSPTKAEERHRAKSRGGRTTATKGQRVASLDEIPDAPQTAADAKAWASWLAVAVATGKVDRTTGREIAGVLRTFLTSLEKAETEAKVEELRQDIAALKKNRGLEVVK